MMSKMKDIQKMIYMFNEVFSGMKSDIAAAIRATETPYDAARQIAVNFSLPPYLTRDLFECLQVREIYESLI